MRVSVVCNDSLMRDGLTSLLGSIESVRLSPSDGTARGAAQLMRQAAVDTLVVWMDRITRDEADFLAACRANGRVALIAVVCETDDLVRVARMADALVRRSEGLAGLQAAVDRVRSRVERPVLRMAPPDERPRRRRLLTRRENDVIRLVAQGKSNRQIADHLGLREQSVKNLVSGIMRKLNCENRVQLALHFAAEPTKIA